MPLALRVVFCRETLSEVYLSIDHAPATRIPLNKYGKP